MPSYYEFSYIGRRPRPGISDEGEGVRGMDAAAGISRREKGRSPAPTSLFENSDRNRPKKLERHEHLLGRHRRGSALADFDTGGKIA